jgi:predicted Rossmann fold nucleotide-binding protein DprA/Smf involved in DNA uptake
MRDTLDQARKAIEARLHELEDEAKHLRDALGNLDHHRLRGRRRPTTKRSTARRAPRGQRQQQFLAAVKKSPGTPVSQIAKDMGVAPSQLYPTARRLREKGEIRRQGKGYAVKR